METSCKISFSRKVVLKELGSNTMFSEEYSMVAYLHFPLGIC